jgi:uncharacterized repeat protein (TIGR03803 family)
MKIPSSTLVLAVDQHWTIDHFLCEEIRGGMAVTARNSGSVTGNSWASWGVALMVVMAVFLCSAQIQAQTFTVLHSFTGADGAGPDGNLSRDILGDLYGTTSSGGAHNLGTVFKLKTTGSETVLHSFSGYSSDGFGPFAGMIRDASGNFLGTTFEGGKGFCGLRGLPVGCGVVFKLDTTGKETVLYNFGLHLGDGAIPEGALVRDASGNLYGTTSSGGTHGEGTVFKLTSTGAETVLHNFTNGADGALPHSALVRDGSGNLIGSAYEGGYFNNSLCAGSGCGVIFKLSPTNVVTVLHRFTGGTDGAFPYAGLIRDGSGNLYGTTVMGGNTTCNSGYGCGTVFKLDATGKKTILHRFNRTDGASPYAALLRDAAGNLYGTTSEGGAHNKGTVFKLDSTGKETVLHSFSGAGGMYPLSPLTRDGAGNLYGTASQGGAHGFGTVFRIAF